MKPPTIKTTMREVNHCRSGQCDRLGYCCTPDLCMVPNKSNPARRLAKVALIGFIALASIALVHAIFV